MLNSGTPPYQKTPGRTTGENREIGESGEAWLGLVVRFRLIESSLSVKRVPYILADAIYFETDSGQR